MRKRQIARIKHSPRLLRAVGRITAVSASGNQVMAYARPKNSPTGIC
jgi:hypothetical protein